MSELRPHSPGDADANLARRLLSALVAGAGLHSISADENLAQKRAETIVREELARRWVPPVADFAKIQIDRLEILIRGALDRAQKGDLAAMDRALRIFDRLDRYHGFSRASPALEPYDDAERERLLNKLNEIAERLQTESPEANPEG